MESNKQVPKAMLGGGTAGSGWVGVGVRDSNPGVMINKNMT